MMRHISKEAMLLAAAACVFLPGCGGSAEGQPSNEATPGDLGEQDQDLRFPTPSFPRQCCVLKFGDDTRCGDFRALNGVAGAVCLTEQIKQGASSSHAHSGRCSERVECGGSPPGGGGGGNDPPPPRPCNGERCCEPAVVGDGCLICARNDVCP